MTIEKMQQARSLSEKINVIKSDLRNLERIKESEQPTRIYSSSYGASMTEQEGRMIITIMIENRRG